ncbi:regulator of chromosome condensation [Paragonimus westermani]|uniref:Regulator of chromosome condensation n=1 Tax=Paragonimus westermani TaxID=34504 RepID=A0A5J4NVF4_9TREM|nr:regulator of chromosome condensation [Paragonimus westermani]
MISRPHVVTKSASSARPKRSSLHLEVNSKKRRKVEHSAGSRSPLVHNAISLKQTVAYQIPFTTPGLPLLFGVGDTGQLGLGPDVTERCRPTRLNGASLAALGIDEDGLETFVTQVCAGGMHTVCLTSAGRVFTFGCNDEGALGRKLSETYTVSETAAVSSKLHMGETAQSEVYDSVAVTDETHPAFVPLPLGIKVSMVTAGDSHTAALDTDGQVWLWGTFRGPNGPIGLTQAGEISMLPRRLLMDQSVLSVSATVDGRPVSNISITSSSHLMPGARVIKIASGQDHLACLTDEGRLYTMGCGEQGQLGRIAERFARTGGRSGMSALLHPAECRVRGAVRFSDAWAGGFATFARCQATKSIYVCGLNNYGQLGLKGPVNRVAVPSAAAPLSGTQNGGGLEEDDEDEATEGIDEEDMDVDLPVDATRVIIDQNEADKSEAALVARQGPLIQFMLTRARAFDPARGWCQFAISMHHTVALDSSGHVFSLGRSEYGRLGLGKVIASSSISVPQPTRVQGLLSDRTCSWVGCGEACSFAVDTTGIAYSWGIGSNRQLGHSNEDDSDEDCCEPGIILGKQLQGRYVSMVDAGGQHTVLLAHSSKPFVLEPSNEVSALGNVAVGGDDGGSTIVTTNPLGPSDQINTVSPSARSFVGSCVPTETASGVPFKLAEQVDICTEPLLIPPVGSLARRNRRLSPCSVTLLVPGAGSTAGSTAGATINSSVHSSAVSDTSSVGSCASNTSTSSQLNSAKSTDGGGSSRCSSFDTYSVQSSLPMGPPAEDCSIPSASNGSLMLDPLSASLLANARSVSQTGRAVGATSVRAWSSSQIRSAGMSICSTSSEPGLPNDTISLGSMTASPADLISGEQSNN